ncbi:MAG: hypothetical protein IID37_00005 [Planctomycetes bacterium]|nr:hypothetical protein [Planctomycetota bacterium]
MRLLCMGQPAATSEVIELATYLRGETNDVTIMCALLSRLKDRKRYHDCVLELGFAHRFRAVGAKVEWEPKTNRGLGDLLVRYRGDRWVCECSKQHISDVQAKRMDLRDRLVQQIGKKALCDVPVVIRVRLARTADLSVFQRTPREVARLVRELSARPWNTYRFDENGLSIEVRQLDDSVDGNPYREGFDSSTAQAAEWEVVYDTTRVPQSEVDGLINAARRADRPPPTAGRVVARVFLTANCDDTAIEPKLISKIKRKLKQARSDLPRIVVLESLGDMAKLNWNLIEAELEQSFKRHPDFAALFVVGRMSYAMRHGYKFQAYVNRHCSVPLPADLMERWGHLEGVLAIY